MVNLFFEKCVTLEKLLLHFLHSLILHLSTSHSSESSSCASELRTKSKKIFGTDCWVLKSPPMFNADVETLDQCDQMAEFFHIFPSLAIKNYPIANKLPNESQYFVKYKIHYQKMPKTFKMLQNVIKYVQKCALERFET